MYKIIFTALLLSTVTINAQALKKSENMVKQEVSSKDQPLKSIIQTSKSKIDQEKERIVKANTILLNDAKSRVTASTEKFKKATAIYEQEKAKYKTVLAIEKKNIKRLAAEIKKYQ